MITNPERLFQGCPPGAPHYYRLRLVDHYIVQPLGRLFELTITGALRQQAEQANLLYADGTKVPEEDKAKGTSQHVLGEVVDLDGPDVRLAWEYAVKHLHPWQAILYLYESSEPKSIHLSIPSSHESIVQKTLIKWPASPGDKGWRFWRDEWPAARRGN